MTAPSPGIISTTMLNAYYDSHDDYLKAIAREMKNEYQAINKAGLILQIDAPDLAMDRTMMYRDLDDAGFVKAIERHIAAINEGIAGIPRDRVRLHVCYGNWEGPHIHDIPLEKILPVLYQANVGALSIEFSNPRHAHEYAALKTHPLPKDMLLIPGVVETTSNFVEHPEVVARRIEEAVATVGDRERVIASSDCGFGTFTKREWVIEPVVWLKLAAIRKGADIASRGCGARRWRGHVPQITLISTTSAIRSAARRCASRCARKGSTGRRRGSTCSRPSSTTRNISSSIPKAWCRRWCMTATPITELTLICEYIDDAFPDPPLKPADAGSRARMRMWSKFVDEGLFEGVTELSFSAMFRERMKNMPEEIRQVRFANIGDPRRRDRFMSTYELGVQSPYVLHAIGAYERAFKYMEETLEQGGPWLLGRAGHARRHQPDAVRGAARLSRPARRVGRRPAAHQGVVGAGAAMAELQARLERSHQRNRICRDGDARAEDPRRGRGAARRK